MSLNLSSKIVFWNPLGTNNQSDRGKFSHQGVVYKPRPQKGFNGILKSWFYDSSDSVIKKRQLSHHFFLEELYKRENVKAAFHCNRCIPSLHCVWRLMSSLDKVNCYQRPCWERTVFQCTHQLGQHKVSCYFFLRRVLAIIRGKIVISFFSIFFTAIHF